MFYKSRQFANISSKRCFVSCLFGAGIYVRRGWLIRRPEFLMAKKSEVAKREVRADQNGQ